MNRVAAIQKSSRTMTIAWTCSPSHCRRAATSSVFSSPRLASSHCSNWSRTSRTFWPDRQRLPPPQRRQRLDQAAVRRQVGARLAQALQQPGLGLLGRRLDVDRQDVLGQPGQQARLDQRRLAAARGAVDQPDPEGLVGVGRLDPASSRTGCSRAGRRGPGGRAAARGRSRRRARRTTAAPWGRS